MAKWTQEYGYEEYLEYLTNYFPQQSIAPGKGYFSGCSVASFCSTTPLTLTTSYTACCEEPFLERAQGITRGE